MDPIDVTQDDPATCMSRIRTHAPIVADLDDMSEVAERFLEPQLAAPLLCDRQSILRRWRKQFMGTYLQLV